MKKRLLSPPPPHFSAIGEIQDVKNLWMWDLHRFTKIVSTKKTLRTFQDSQFLERLVLRLVIWCCFFKGDVHSLDLQKPLANGFQDSKSGWKNSCVDGNGLSAPNGLLDGAPDSGMSWDPNLCSKIGAKSYQCSKKLCNLASKTDLWALWHIIAMFKDTVTLST